MAKIESKVSDRYDLEDRADSKELDDNKGKLMTLETDFSYTHKIIWRIVLFYILVHVGAVIGLVWCFSGRVKFVTMVWALFYSYVGTEGAHMGSHRCFCHRAFKATPLLKIILLVMQTTAGQHSNYIWSRDHRMHHRYADTDGDPHNSKRGMFYSHIGWLMTSRHPICKALRKTIDMSDLQQDKYVMFQYYTWLYFILGFLLPVWVPVYYFKKTFTGAMFVCYFLRYVYSMHVTAFINSLAHKFGTRPYDKTIQPVESWFVSLLSLGEGWHNYHHAYPWDYKAAEIGMPLNSTAHIIKFCETIGLAYDLKTVDDEMVKKKIKSRGDGTYSSDEIGSQVTAFGPLHPLNPSYSVKYLDPEISVKVRMKPNSG